MLQWFGPGKWLESGQVWSVDVRTALVQMPVSVTREGTAVPEPRVSSVTRNPVTGGAGGGTSVTRDVLDPTTPDQNKPGELTSSLKPKGVNQTAGRGAGAQIKSLSSEPASARGSWAVTVAPGAAAGRMQTPRLGVPHRSCTPGCSTAASPRLS